VNGSIWPTATVPLDGVTTAAIEGATDQMRFYAAVDGRAEAATVNAMASGLQHSTTRAISHRLARSLLVSAPTGSAASRIGRLGFGLPSGLEPHPVHGLARARHRGHHRPISEPTSHASTRPISLA
jgi:hypothetical protein